MIAIKGTAWGFYNQQKIVFAVLRMMNYFECTADKMSYTDVTLNMMSSYLNKTSNHISKVLNL